ncbi:MAG: DUF1521 domain-containing protein [Alsobacter sp.]
MELGNINSAFATLKALDRNSDGAVSFCELVSAYKDKADLDGNGSVDISESLSFLNSIDGNQDGFLSGGEFLTYAGVGCDTGSTGETGETGETGGTDETDGTDGTDETGGTDETDETGGTDETGETGETGGTDETDGTGGTEDTASNWSFVAGDRSATIKLGDRYEISIDQNLATWHITDLCDGSKTCIWGDPHVVEGDGGSWDFKTTSTFVLEDGTKITCNTVDPNGQAVTAPTNGVSLSGTLTITNGKDAIVVENVAGGITSINRWGNIADAKLVVTQSRDGKAIDAAVADGTVFKAGEGDSWLAGSTVVTSDLFNADGTLKGFDADAQTALALAASAAASLSNDNHTAATDKVAA